ncbi:unnamed protein product [Cunninghamella blakesleeana]
MLRAKTGIRCFQRLSILNSLKIYNQSLIRSKSISATPLNLHCIVNKNHKQSQIKAVSALIEDPETKLTIEEQRLANQVYPTLYIGDYVEVFVGSQYSGIIVEQQKIAGRQQRFSVLLRNGKTINCRTSNIAFYVSDFISTENVTKYLRQPINIDRTATAMDFIPTELMRAINAYQQTVKFRKGVAIRQLDNLYSNALNQLILKQENKSNDLSDASTSITLNELASLAFNTDHPTTIDRHATFLYLVASNLHFKPDNNILNTDEWIVRPSNDSAVIEKMANWIRTKDDNYTGFLKRANQYIDFYKSNVNEYTGTIPQPKIDEIKKLKFTNNDSTFINFIIDWIKIPKVILESPHEVFGPTILKGLQCYDDLYVDRTLAATFLKQIGVFQPWDNIGLAEESKNIHPFTWSKKAEQDEKKMDTFTDMFLNGNQQQWEKNGFYGMDPCDALRHDFKDLPVYTIDDPSAKEIDDGISVEHIPGTNNEKDKTWLHIHIADPTAYVPPNHELANIMSDRIQTLYLPEQHFPMLPETLSSQTFSLGSSARMIGNGSQYAFTFSALLDDQGDIKEYKVRPSLVRNVIKLHYDDVDQMLKDDVSLNIKMDDTTIDFNATYIHPNNHDYNNDGFNQSTSHDLITSKVKEDLIDLCQLAQLHNKQRIKNGALNFIRPNPTISLKPEPLDLPQFSFDPNVLKYASDIPTIKLSLDKSAVSISRSFVAEMMILGGRVVSRYAQENNITLPFRTQQWNPTQENIKNEILMARDQETGILSLNQLLKYITSLPPAGLTTEFGKPHASMGIVDGYCKATSPLRRYMDMIIHWQLKAHLTKQKKLPFDKSLLDQLGPYIESREKQMMKLQQRALQYWVLSLMQRLENDNTVWRCMIQEQNRIARTKLGGSMEAATATILELGIRARVDHLKHEVQVGDILKTRVSEINPLLGIINLVPIQQ